MIEVTNLIEQEIKAIKNIPSSNDYFKTLKLIEKANKLVITGMGKAGHIGINIATTFCSTGTPSVFLHPSESQHGDLGILQKGDVIIAISNSGKTKEVIELIHLTKNLIKETPIIVITGNTTSELAQLADIVLHTGGSPEICPLGLTPTTSTTCMTVIGDILVVELMKKIKFTKKEYSKRHHSGYLGQKSKI
jgi:arabinose-5-phosphate isomerase